MIFNSIFAKRVFLKEGGVGAQIEVQVEAQIEGVVVGQVEEGVEVEIRAKRLRAKDVLRISAVGRKKVKHPPLSEAKRIYPEKIKRYK